MILYSQVFMGPPLPPNALYLLNARSLAHCCAVTPRHALGGKIGDHTVAAERAQPFPFAHAIRRPRNDANVLIMQSTDERFVDVVIAGKAPRDAKTLRVVREVERVTEDSDTEVEGNVATRKLGNRGVIEGCDDDLRPVADLGDQRFFPVAALHLEDHRGALREWREIAKQ